MSNLFWLTDAQMARLEPFFPKSHGKPRVDDRRDLPQGASHGDQPASEKGGPGDQRDRLIGLTKGGMNTKLHAGTAALLGSLPQADGFSLIGAMTQIGSEMR